MIRAAVLAAAFASIGGAGAGAGTLEGRLVTFSSRVWGDTGFPDDEAHGKTVMVGEGVEFGLEPEEISGGLVVVPVQVEIKPQRVELTYPLGSGNFYTAPFNGYELRFETECALFAGWTLDRDFTTMPIKPEDIFTEKGALFINVSGMSYGPDARLAIDLDVTDCPLS
ncbi:MAG: hypothetical protein WBP18_02625 [Paracoccaceae bacterium]